MFLRTLLCAFLLFSNCNSMDKIGAGAKAIGVGFAKNALKITCPVIYPIVRTIKDHPIKTVAGIAVAFGGYQLYKRNKEKVDTSVRAAFEKIRPALPWIGGGLVAFWGYQRTQNQIAGLRNQIEMLDDQLDQANETLRRLNTNVQGMDDRMTALGVFGFLYAFRPR